MLHASRVLVASFLVVSTVTGVTPAILLHTWVSTYAFPSILVPGMVLNYKTNYWWLIRLPSINFNHSFTVDQTIQIRSLSTDRLTLSESNTGTVRVPDECTDYDTTYYDSVGAVKKDSRKKEWAYNDTLVVDSSYVRVNPYPGIRGVFFRARLFGTTDNLHWFSTAPGTRLPILIDPNVRVGDKLTLWYPARGDDIVEAGTVTVTIASIIEESIFGEKRQVVVGTAKEKYTRWFYPVTEELRFVWDRQTGILLTAEDDSSQEGVNSGARWDESYGKGMFQLANPSVLKSTSSPTTASTSARATTTSLLPSSSRQTFSYSSTTTHIQPPPSNDWTQQPITTVISVISVLAAIVLFTLFVSKRRKAFSPISTSQVTAMTPDAPHATPITTAPVPSAKMKHCPECGLAMRLNANICPRCGTKQEYFGED